jgi:hypothetical protein
MTATEKKAEPPYSGMGYAIDETVLLVSGACKRCPHLPSGARQRELDAHLQRAFQILEDLRKDPLPDAERNLSLFSLKRSTEVSNEFGAPV